MDYGSSSSTPPSGPRSRDGRPSRRDQGDEVPPQDRRRGLRHQDPAGGQVLERPQGQDHHHVPGPEVFHPELGKKSSTRIADQMDGIGQVGVVPRLDGRNMVMVLAPDKRAKQSAASRDPATTATDRPRARRRPRAQQRPRHQHRRRELKEHQRHRSTAGAAASDAVPPAAGTAPRTRHRVQERAERHAKMRPTRVRASASR